jgi:hypothetical protein
MPVELEVSPIISAFIFNLRAKRARRFCCYCYLLRQTCHETRGSHSRGGPLKSGSPRGSGWVLPALAHVMVLVAQRNHPLPRGGISFIGTRA